MSGQRTSFGKLQRDRAKKEKAAAKRERRRERDSEPDTTSGPVPADTAEGPPRGEIPADQLLGLIESIHQRFEAGTMSYDDFEQQKAELLGRLQID